LLGAELVFDKAFGRQMQERNVVELERTEDDGGAFFEAVDPAEGHCGADAVGGGVFFVGDVLAELGGIESRIGGGQDFVCEPAGTVHGDWFQQFFGGGDARVNALGELEAGFGGPVVVFAGGDVTGTAGEVNVSAGGLFALPLLAGQANKIAADVALAVVAHRMRGVVVAGDDFFGAAVIGDGFELWIDESFRQGDEFGVFAGAATHLADLAGGGNVQAAIAGDLFHFRFAVSDVRDGAGERDGDFDRAAGAVEAGIEEFQFDHFEAGVLSFDESFGVQANEGGVVLVDALDGDTVRRGARGFGQGGAPGDVSLVQDAGPVDGADYDGLARAEEDKANGFELVIAVDDWFDPAATEGMANGRSNIEAERGDEEGGGLSRG